MVQSSSDGPAVQSSGVPMVQSSSEVRPLQLLTIAPPLPMLRTMRTTAAVASNKEAAQVLAVPFVLGAPLQCSAALAHLISRLQDLRLLPPEGQVH